MAAYSHPFFTVIRGSAPERNEFYVNNNKSSGHLIYSIWPYHLGIKW